MAKQIRVGLEDDSQVKAMISEPVATDPLDKLSVGKPIRTHVKEFGALFGAICFAIAAWRLYKEKPLQPTVIFLAVGAVFSILGFFAPRALHPIWKAWMGLAHYMSIVMTFVILGLAWIIGFIPMALLLRVIGVKVIDRTYRDAATETYWHNRDPIYDDFARLKQQY